MTAPTSNQLAIPRLGRLCRRNMRDGAAVVGVLHFDEDVVLEEGAAYLLWMDGQKTFLLDRNPISVEQTEASARADSPSCDISGRLMAPIWRKTTTRDALMIRVLDVFDDGRGWVVYGASSHPGPEQGADHDWWDVQDGRMAAIAAPMNDKGAAIGQLLTTKAIWPDQHGTMHVVSQMSKPWLKDSLRHSQLLALSAASPLITNHLREIIHLDPGLRAVESGSSDRQYCRYLAGMQRLGALTLSSPIPADVLAGRETLVKALVQEMAEVRDWQRVGISSTSKIDQVRSYDAEQLRVIAQGFPFPHLSSQDNAEVAVLTLTEALSREATESVEPDVAAERINIAQQQSLWSAVAEDGRYTHVLAWAVLVYGHADKLDGVLEHLVDGETGRKMARSMLMHAINNNHRDTMAECAEVLVRALAPMEPEDAKKDMLRMFIDAGFLKQTSSLIQSGIIDVFDDNTQIQLLRSVITNSHHDWAGKIEHLTYWKQQGLDVNRRKNTEHFLEMVDDAQGRFDVNAASALLDLGVDPHTSFGKRKTVMDVLKAHHPDTHQVVQTVLDARALAQEVGHKGVRAAGHKM